MESLTKLQDDFLRLEWQPWRRLSETPRRSASLCVVIMLVAAILMPAAIAGKEYGSPFLPLWLMLLVLPCLLEYMSTFFVTVAEQKIAFNKIALALFSQERGDEAKPICNAVDAALRRWDGDDRALVFGDALFVYGEIVKNKEQYAMDLMPHSRGLASTQSKITVSIESETGAVDVYAFGGRLAGYETPAWIKRFERKIFRTIICIYAAFSTFIVFEAAMVAYALAVVVQLYGIRKLIVHLMEVGRQGRDFTRIIESVSMNPTTRNCEQVDGMLGRLGLGNIMYIFGSAYCDYLRVKMRNS